MLLFAQLERLDKFYRFGHGHVAHARDVNASDRDGKRLLAQTLTMAFRAGDLGHALFYLGAHGRALRLEIPALKVFAYTLERYNTLPQWSLRPSPNRWLLWLRR